MRKYLTTLTLIAIGLPLVGCASRGSNLKKVHSAELPKIPRLERNLPVHVDVEGSRGRRTVVLADPVPEPQLTAHEKEVLGEPKDDGIDLFEYYVPGRGRNPLVGSYRGGVTVGYGGHNSVGAAGGYKSSYWALTSQKAGVLVGHGPRVVRSGVSGPSARLTGTGPKGGVTVAYDRSSRVAGHETRRYYRP